MASKSGHALNNQLLRNVQNDPSSYEIVTFNNDNDCPISYVSDISLSFIGYVIL